MWRVEDRGVEEGKKHAIDCRLRRISLRNKIRWGKRGPFVQVLPKWLRFWSAPLALFKGKEDQNVKW